MKKIMALTLALVMALSLAACGDNAESANTESASASSETEAQSTETEEAEKPAVSGEITAEQLMDYPESPEEDFLVQDNADGVTIDSYVGDDEIVVIPAMIKESPVTVIGSGVFSNDCPVKAVKIPDTVTLIKSSVFGLNTNLEVVVFGSSVKEVGEGVLQNCTNLRELVLNDGLQKVGGLFAGGCKSLESVVIPASLTDIHHMSFKGASEDFVIYGEAGSAAEQHAADRGLTFQVKE